MNLIEHIEKLYEKPTATAVSALLSNLRLPVPEAGEYTKSWDDGFIVFLNPYGCLLRLVDKEKSPLIHDPAILRPLASRNAGRMRVDINPGVECPIDPRDVPSLFFRLKERGIIFWDGKVRNCGYLPAQQGERRIPVVIDPDSCAVRQLSQSVSLVDRMFQVKNIVTNTLRICALPSRDKPPEAQISTQDMIYGQLSSIFNAAWPTDREAPKNPIGISKFWDTCHSFREKGLLITSWLSKDMGASNYKNANHGSEKFASRLSSQSRHELSLQAYA
jgi:hypothetical protein